MEISGKLVKVLATQRFVSQKNGNEYVKSAFVLETSGQYPKKIAFVVLGEDKFKQMGLVVGRSYRVSFDVESHEWNERWFTECAAWKAVSLDDVGQVTSTSEGGNVVREPELTDAPKVEIQRDEEKSGSDLPF